MCGIIGYTGSKKVLPYLLTGLKNLEYRGYDSCGIALMEENGIKIVKTKGEVDKLVQITSDLETKATLGIGHTRWATHGKPSKKNAHPHTDCTGKLALVHNGIIENFKELKKKLIKKGHKLKSETDTEVLVHLIEEKLKKEKDILLATRKALSEIIGAYGIVLISSDFPDQIIVARNSSPLLLGFGEKGNFVASDQPALVSWTQDMATLKNEQVARITKNKVEIQSLDGQSERYQKIFVEDKFEQVSKKGYKHFMYKEIQEQPEVIKDALSGRFDKNKGVKLGGIEDYLEVLCKKDFITLVGCGTSKYACMTAKYFFQDIAEIPVVVEDATDLVGSNYPWEKGQPVVFVSQSGETADILSVLRKAKEKDILPFGLVNVIGSSIARETEAGIYTRSGFEIGVASTKNFTNQILAFLLWAILLGVKKGNLKGKRKKELFAKIDKIPEYVQKVLDKEKTIKKLAKKLKKRNKIYILGRKKGYALCLEAALKIKEISYLPAEGIGAGFLKHGPLALVEKDTVLLFLLPDDPQFEKNLNSIHEAAARGGDIYILTNKDKEFEKEFNVYNFPKCNQHLNIFPMTAWVQMLAYWTARELDRPIDKPRNLAKSVTVE